jgi:membrane protein implicated in regulation of membrane protease activity
LRSAEAPTASGSASLVGSEAQVTVTVEPGRYGTVLVHFDGAPVQRRATSDHTIPAGHRARVVAVVGTDLVLEPVTPAVPSATHDPTQA